MMEQISLKTGAFGLQGSGAAQTSPGLPLAIVIDLLSCVDVFVISSSSNNMVHAEAKGAHHV